MTSLDEAQIDRYAHKIEVLGSTRALLLEVLSTCPFPLASVLARSGLGRFRVTQKADPRNPTDVYSTYQAKRPDWVMLGNHDTPPIWRCLKSWRRDKIDAWCDHLQARLGKDAVDRQVIANDPRALAQPMLADLFVSEASSVAVFFADLFGIDAIYNQPGVVDEANWTLRAGNDFASRRGLDVPAAMATALRARGKHDLAARVLAHAAAHVARSATGPSRP